MGNISTADMVTDCKLRVPARLSSTFWMSRLNEAYRWVCQQGAFPWTIQKIAITIAAGTGQWDLPTGWSPGRPSFLFKAGLLIPQKSMEEALKQNVLSAELIVPGNYSCWTYTIDLTGAPSTYQYKGQIFPYENYPTVDDTSLWMTWHSTDITPLTESTSEYFPTPVEFDELIMALAESEARRRYGMAGWEKVQTRTQASIQNLLKSYITDKHTQFGLENTVRHAQESQAAKAV